MFKVTYHSTENRKVQQGVRDLKMTKCKCFYKAFVEASESFCTTSSFCPLRYVFEKKRHQFDVILKNPTIRESVNITKILKSFTLVDATQSDFDEMDIVLDANNITMKDVYYYTAQDCDELLQRCSWEGKIHPCSQLFNKVFGGGNFCCSFNYPLPQSLLKTKPKIRKFLKTNDFGRSQGLSFVARPIKDKFYYRNDYGRNLRIILHHIFSFPLYNENDIFAPMRKETNVEMDCVYSIADAKVQQLPTTQRDCIFSWERQLQHFPTYTHSNCLLDCRVNRIIRACGCATYFYPSVNASICHPSKLFCNLLNQNLDVRTNPDGTISIKNWDCPDDCAILRIHYTVQSTNFVSGNNFTVDEFYDGVEEDNAIVHINFGKSFTKLLNRRLVKDEIELASNVGGIIALFMGCSLMSIFEIAYFLCIRLFANYRRLCLQNNLVSVPIEYTLPMSTFICNKWISLSISQ